MKIRETHGISNSKHLSESHGPLLAIWHVRSHGLILCHNMYQYVTIMSNAFENKCRTPNKSCQDRESLVESRVALSHAESHVGDVASQKTSVVGKFHGKGMEGAEIQSHVPNQVTTCHNTSSNSTEWGLLLCAVVKSAWLRSLFEPVLCCTALHVLSIPS